MSQRRKIAIAYAFAVPVVLVVVLFLHAALLGVSSSASGMAQAAKVMQETDTALSLLTEAATNAQKYVTSGGDQTWNSAYQDSVSQLRKVLQGIDDETKIDKSVHAKSASLASLVTKQFILFEQSMAVAKKNPSARDKTATNVEDQKLRDDIGKCMAEIKSAQQTRLQQQGEAATRSVGLARMFTTYGGGLVIWLVGVAAFLLFHDEKARAWAGLERRVHTKILQTLPLGVSLATDSGTILYANAAEEALLGYERGELLGNNVTLLHDLEGQGAAQTLNEILDRLGAGKTWSGELPVRKKDGTIQKEPSWVMNLDVPGKVYRVFIHNTY
jgi:PAS domain S-box-containing protein